MATNFEPTYYHSSVKAFSHSLDVDPWAVGNLSLRKQSEVKAAEFAYLCAQKHTHRHANTAMLCYVSPRS